MEPSNENRPILSRLSEDDFPWYYSASWDEVFLLILNPYAFIDELNRKLLRAPSPQDPGGAPSESRKIVLAPEYTIRARLQEANVDVLLPGPFLLHGISGTGSLTIRPRNQSVVLNFWDKLSPRLSSFYQARTLASDEATAPDTALSGESWERLWDDWSTKGSLDVGFVPSFGHGYGHFEIAPAGLPRELRANRIAAFLMWASLRTDYGQRGDKPYLNRLLEREDAQAEHIDVATGLASRRAGVQRCFNDLTKEGLQGVVFTLAGREEDYSEDEEAPDPMLPACWDGSGPTLGGKIDLNEVVIKDYRVPKPDPEEGEEDGRPR